ncbi:hypothetical protein O181_001835 [Austropuccinia psidii MF-1]|uniref:GS catalytic domain-containing protein n=1 Tax=Austropuccinia psidii MF-1 TaxID=1389203 RepID=A0A9Q3BBV7_9BASI|nr:hypothetical protein [Austropuccinia psidii MF-1]
MWEFRKHSYHQFVYIGSIMISKSQSIKRWMPFLAEAWFHHKELAHCRRLLTRPASAQIIPPFTFYSSPIRHQPLHLARPSANKVKLVGIDADGVLRGKLISKNKFISCIKSNGLGWCSVIFGWDMHDRAYHPELSISNIQNGYRDLVARIDLDTGRRIPWEDDIPLFLVDFFEISHSDTPLCVCPRGLLKTVLKRLEQEAGIGALAGIEYEYFQFKETAESIKEKGFVDLTPLTVGMHGYSVLRPSLNQEYFHELFESALGFGIAIEGHHTETGPGVYETALAYTDALKMADNAALFKLTAKNVGMKHGIIPSFMAKPHANLPGCSGHVHISLKSIASNTNLFAGPNLNPAWPDTSQISVQAEEFIAGLMTCLPDMIPCLIPTINGYKRLVEGFWAATNVSWGLDSRLASVRVISPPSCTPEATRLEIRVPGADMNPHYALSAILAAGYYGIHNHLSLRDMPPISLQTDNQPIYPLSPLPKTLMEATQNFMKPDSKARKILGDQFVDHFGKTRENEWKLYCQAVTNWELERYLELA